MPRKFELNPAREKRKLGELYHRIRKLIEQTLERMETDPDKISGALVDVCVRSIRQMTSLLSDIEKIDAQEKAKEEQAAALAKIKAELPVFPQAAKAPPKTREDDFDVDLSELPFPKLRGKEAAE